MKTDGNFRNRTRAFEGCWELFDELVSLLPEAYRPLKLQWVNARARGDCDIKAVLTDIVNQYRREDYGKTDRLAELEFDLEESKSEVKELEEEVKSLEDDIKELEGMADAARDEHDKELQEMGRENQALTVRVWELEDELKSTVQKAMKGE